MEKRFYGEFAKVDDEKGIIFGYAIVCKIDGVEYFDRQDDHVPEDAMLDATVDFMKSSREARTMHTEERTGTVLFAFPMTQDIADALEIDVKKTGLLIGMKPDDPELIEAAKRGEFRGFSIGGERVEDEDVD